VAANLRCGGKCYVDFVADEALLPAMETEKVGQGMADYAQGAAFRLRRMHEMQTVFSGVRGVCLSVCPSVRVSRGSTAKRIKILFGVNTAGGTRNVALDGSLPAARGDEIDAALARLLWHLV